ncbi:MAG: hypothetical protein NZ872_00005 [Archaeoglobaceae archaeon]|nr:hypothetical protein [Archaeoglobaceae archaeon]MDW8127583.1 hypothetical protein [Archaeoglobaceae archaeon]
MIGEKFVLKLAEKLGSEKNVERFVRYYWLISTFRLALGASIAILILLFGYRFSDTVSWVDALLGGE